MIFIYRQRPISRQYIQETHIDGRFDSAQAISQRTQQIKALGEKFFTSWGARQILFSRFFSLKGYPHILLTEKLNLKGLKMAKNMKRGKKFTKNI